MSGPVLVTGPTGFIGRELVRRLLAEGRPVVAMARRRGDQSARDRVSATVGSPLNGRLLDVVEADPAQPGCGLEAGDWRRLRDTVETVIHCAGETLFFPKDLARFRVGHRDVPLAILRRLRGGRLRRLAYLSTAYVCGRRAGTVLECEADVGQGFHNPYERVKLESELAIRRAGRQLGIDVRVMRPSIVVGPAPATAGGNPSNLFFRLIRMTASLARHSNGADVRLRIRAAPRARFNIVPVEYVAEAVAALAEHPKGAGQTFHLVVSAAPTQENVLAMIAGRLGVRGLSLVDPTRVPVENPLPLERRVARMLSGYHPYLQRDLKFDDTNARRVLDRCGVRPSFLSPEVVDRLIHQALAAPDSPRAVRVRRANYLQGPLMMCPPQGRPNGSSP